MSDTQETVKCMCGHTVPESEVVFINPATKAATWVDGLPYCQKCSPPNREDG